MKISTWNVNSLRIRLPQVLQWLALYQPDILVLQEIKMPTANFPHDAFLAIGYQAFVHGQKTYNGVAVLTRSPAMLIDQQLPYMDDNQSRLLAAQIGDLRIINVYIPNGQSVDSDKFHYKLAWLQALHHYAKQTLTTHQKVIILGDFNIAPTDEDVHDPLRWAGKVCCTVAERDLLQELLTLGFEDSFRLFAQQPRTFSWWDYRTMGFRRNAGLRIDLILVSNVLVEYCQAATIDKTPRAWQQPSDHAPVTLELMTSQYF